MNLATKAAIYNALLFPGWGHFYLKKYKRGMMFIVPVLAGMLSLCWAVVQVAISILQANPIKKSAVDINAVIQLSADATKAIDSNNNISLILLFMILFWIVSIIDAYQIGKKQMQEDDL